MQEIWVIDKSVAEMTELCLEQILCQPSNDQPYTPRITLIGPKESGRFDTASEISKKFNLVHSKQ